MKSKKIKSLAFASLAATGIFVPTALATVSANTASEENSSTSVADNFANNAVALEANNFTPYQPAYFENVSLNDFQKYVDQVAKSDYFNQLMAENNAMFDEVSKLPQWNQEKKGFLGYQWQLLEKLQSSWTKLTSIINNKLTNTKALIDGVKNTKEANEIFNFISGYNGKITNSSYIANSGYINDKDNYPNDTALINAYLLCDLNLAFNLNTTYKMLLNNNDKANELKTKFENLKELYNSSKNYLLPIDKMFNFQYLDLFLTDVPYYSNFGQYIENNEIKSTWQAFIASPSGKNFVNYLQGTEDYDTFIKNLQTEEFNKLNKNLSSSNRFSANLSANPTAVYFKYNDFPMTSTLLNMFEYQMKLMYQSNYWFLNSEKLVNDPRFAISNLKDYPNTDLVNGWKSRTNGALKTTANKIVQLYNTVIKPGSSLTLEQVASQITSDDWEKLYNASIADVVKLGSLLPKISLFIQRNIIMFQACDQLIDPITGSLKFKYILPSEKSKMVTLPLIQLGSDILVSPNYSPNGNVFKSKENGEPILKYYGLEAKSNITPFPFFEWGKENVYNFLLGKNSSHSENNITGLAEVIDTINKKGTEVVSKIEALPLLNQDQKNELLKEIAAAKDDTSWTEKTETIPEKIQKLNKDLQAVINRANDLKDGDKYQLATTQSKDIFNKAFNKNGNTGTDVNIDEVIKNIETEIKDKNDAIDQLEKAITEEKKVLDNEAKVEMNFPALSNVQQTNINQELAKTYSKEGIDKITALGTKMSKANISMSDTLNDLILVPQTRIYQNSTPDKQSDFDNAYEALQSLSNQMLAKPSYTDEDIATITAAIKAVTDAKNDLNGYSAFIDKLSNLSQELRDNLKAKVKASSSDEEINTILNNAKQLNDAIGKAKLTDSYATNIQQEPNYLAADKPLQQAVLTAQKNLKDNAIANATGLNQVANASDLIPYINALITQTQTLDDAMRNLNGDENLAKEFTKVQELYNKVINTSKTPGFEDKFAKIVETPISDYESITGPGGDLMSGTSQEQIDNMAKELQAAYDKMEEQIKSANEVKNKVEQDIQTAQNLSNEQKDQLKQALETAYPDETKMQEVDGKVKNLDTYEAIQKALNSSNTLKDSNSYINAPTTVRKQLDDAIAAAKALEKATTTNSPTDVAKYPEVLKQLSDANNAVAQFSNDKFTDSEQKQIPEINHWVEQNLKGVNSEVAAKVISDFNAASDASQANEVKNKALEQYNQMRQAVIDQLKPMLEDANALLARLNIPAVTKDKTALENAINQAKNAINQNADLEQLNQALENMNAALTQGKTDITNGQESAKLALEKFQKLDQQVVAQFVPTPENIKQTIANGTLKDMEELGKKLNHYVIANPLVNYLQAPELNPNIKLQEEFKPLAPETKAMYQDIDQNDQATIQAQANKQALNNAQIKTLNDIYALANLNKGQKEALYAQTIAAKDANVLADIIAKAQGLDTSMKQLAKVVQDVNQDLSANNDLYVTYAPKDKLAKLQADLKTALELETLATGNIYQDNLASQIDTLANELKDLDANVKQQAQAAMQQAKQDLANKIDLALKQGQKVLDSNQFINSPKALQDELNTAVNNLSQSKELPDKLTPETIAKIEGLIKALEDNCKAVEQFSPQVFKDDKDKQIPEIDNWIKENLTDVSTAVIAQVKAAYNQTDTLPAANEVKAQALKQQATIKDDMNELISQVAQAINGQNATGLKAKLDQLQNKAKEQTWNSCATVIDKLDNLQAAKDAYQAYLDSNVKDAAQYQARLNALNQALNNLAAIKEQTPGITNPLITQYNQAQADIKLLAAQVIALVNTIDTKDQNTFQNTAQSSLLPDNIKDFDTLLLNDKYFEIISKDKYTKGDIKDIKTIVTNPAFINAPKVLQSAILSELKAEATFPWWAYVAILASLLFVAGISLYVFKKK
ncbi:hypothetical protein [Mycoplasma sp. MV126]|uniref:hypothetical protein n=1 Tax=Mycoplasma sp. MV126 TaxID=3401676 RepID=UPI003AABE480